MSQPPYILGNFPRMELVFSLVENQNQKDPQSEKIQQLEKLKKLLDSGAINQDEFNNEKKKILNN